MPLIAILEILILILDASLAMPGGAPCAKYAVPNRLKLEYANMLIIVGRLTGPQFWEHLGGFRDGKVLITDMVRENALGYSHFKVSYTQDIIKRDGRHCSKCCCSAQELIEDRRLAYSYYAVFRQLATKLRVAMSFGIFGIVTRTLFLYEPPTRRFMRFGNPSVVQPPLLILNDFNDGELD